MGQLQALRGIVCTHLLDTKQISRVYACTNHASGLWGRYIFRIALRGTYHAGDFSRLPWWFLICLTMFTVNQLIHRPFFKGALGCGLRELSDLQVTGPSRLLFSSHRSWSCWLQEKRLIDYYAHPIIRRYLLSIVRVRATLSQPSFQQLAASHRPSPFQSGSKQQPAGQLANQPTSQPASGPASQPASQPVSESMLAGSWNRAKVL